MSIDIKISFFETKSIDIYTAVCYNTTEGGDKNEDIHTAAAFRREF